MTAERRRCVLHGCNSYAQPTGVQLCTGHRDVLRAQMLESLRSHHRLNAQTEAGALAVLEALTPVRWERGK